MDSWLSQHLPIAPSFVGASFALSCFAVLRHSAFVRCCASFSAAASAAAS
eukprot:CAMPEP_0184282430 /NCGR_PEP_ID=MMETSP0977-20130417/63594_1 /TAXON_ID=483370 /ORGANISM="non described non described, Strain CCMP2097" /LENGTH=49 /DNA_ID= /DNA_START= /DNA_END= /DNA_ORIENTATION=